MKKIILASLFVSVIVFVSACVPPPGPRVRGDHFPPPPALFFPAPPLLSYWPDYDIYVSMNISSDLVFYRGYWYRKHGEHWYRSNSYNGTWKFMPPGQLPKQFRGLPGNMRDRIQAQPRIRHHDMESNWRKWERDRNNDAKRKENERLDRKRRQDEERIERRDINRQNDKKELKRDDNTYQDDNKKRDWQERKKRKNKQEEEEQERGKGSRGKKKR